MGYEYVFDTSTTPDIRRTCSQSFIFFYDIYLKIIEIKFKVYWYKLDFFLKKKRQI